MIRFLYKNWVMVLWIIIFFAILFNFLNVNRRTKKLQKSKFTVGILIKEYHESLRFLNGEFFFFVKGKKYQITDFKDFSHLKRGDTVLIEYAIEDPSVARVKDSYYMHKFQR